MPDLPKTHGGKNRHNRSERSGGTAQMNGTPMNQGQLHGAMKGGKSRRKRRGSRKSRRHHRKSSRR